MAQGQNQTAQTYFWQAKTSNMLQFLPLKSFLWNVYFAEELTFDINGLTGLMEIDT